MLRPLLKLRGLGLIAFTAFALQIPAHAELTIEITGAGANQIPLAIADFGGEAGASRALTSVIRGDLERSGLFKMIDTSGVAMTEVTPPQYGDWKLRGADALAAGFGQIGQTLASLTGADETAALRITTTPRPMTMTSSGPSQRIRVDAINGGL